MLKESINKRELKGKKPILFRLILLFLILILFILGLFALSVIPYLRNALFDDLQTRARTIASSIAQITASALVNEDYSTVVDHCLKVIEERPSILYLVITRKDGFSLVHIHGGWRNETLQGMWSNPGNMVNRGTFLNSDLVNEKVLHYTYPFSYSGIDWGWIHIGLSTQKFDSDLRNIYKQIVISFLLCMLVGLGISYFFARQITRPILELDKGTRLVGEGNMSTRVRITTGDELESLARSFNLMIETLQKAQKELLGAKTFTENVIESMVDVLVVINPDGTIMTLNQAVLKLLGYNKDEIVGKPISTIFFRKDKDFFDTDELNLLVTGAFIKDLGISLCTKDDKEIPVSLSGSMIKDQEGNAVGFVCVAKDMREINRLINNLEMTKNDLARSYDELKEAQIQLQLIQSGKMSAVGQLAAGVAHEINNPLTGVLGNASILKELMEYPPLRNVEGTETFCDMIELIIESANRCKKIVGDLLSFSRQSGEELVEMNVDEAIEKTLNLVGHQLKLDHISVILNLNSGTAKVKGNLNRLQQVFINIILNAQRFMTGGGDLTISSVVTSDGKNVEVRIKDTGPGISSENLKKIFEPFFSTMSVAQGMGAGTGLGLTISYNIIKNHGGSIEAESEEGKGATFIIRLPVI